MANDRKDIGENSTIHHESVYKQSYLYSERWYFEYVWISNKIKLIYDYTNCLSHTESGEL